MPPTRENREQKLASILSSIGASNPHVAEVAVLADTEPAVASLVDATSISQKLKLLALCWKNAVPSLDVGARIGSSQPAAVVRDLKDMGFVFKKDHPHSTKQEFTPLGTSKPHREIVGYVRSLALRSGHDLSSSQKRTFLAGKEDFLNRKKSNLEADHRVPIEAHRKAGTTPPKPGSLSAADIPIHFQPLSRETNHLKREACAACLRGDDIPLPKVVPAGAYKRNWGDVLSPVPKRGPAGTLPNCYGCFWYDYTKPLRPQDFVAGNLS